jgi:prophage tail gpP-like protein
VAEDPTKTKPQFLLTANGMQYQDWKKLSVVRSLEHLASSFSFSVTNKWIDAQKRIPIRKGDAISVSYFNGSTYRDILTGWIDKPTCKYNATERTMGWTGRSLTEDLVDCSAIHPTGSWKNASLLTIALDVCKPFNLNVIVPAAIQADAQIPFAEHKLNDGETGFEALERACRMRGFVMHDNGAGDVVLDRVGTVKISTSLIFGQNILEGTSEDDLSECFSDYIVKAQTAGGGLDGDTYHAEKLVQKAVAHDPDVPRYRPTIVMAETNDTGKLFQKRANWEAAMRAGRANRITYLADGWEHKQGLWEPNTLVHVEDPNFELNADKLIVTCTYTRDEDGTHTLLELAAPAAFVPSPLSATTTKGQRNPLRD